MSSEVSSPVGASIRVPRWADCTRSWASHGQSKTWEAGSLGEKGQVRARSRRADDGIRTRDPHLGKLARETLTCANGPDFPTEQGVELFVSASCYPTIFIL